MTIGHSRFDEQQLYCIVKEVGPCDVVQVARTTIFSVTPGQTERRQSSERAAVGLSQHVGHRESLVTYAARRGSRIRRPHCGLELWRRRRVLLSRGLRLRRSWTRVTVLVLYKPGPAGPGLS